ncbi:MAG: NAD(P)/FAD-dependent oxidoreductase [Gammaproteobacteria bacterium]|nr:NAD(P)/FAD-dependent oxidoreductase [Gammaproteobacteria bacterium]
MSHPDADVLVIGAGPAGASTAIRLARAGWRVAIIERSPYPRQKVCGECLGPASLHRLHELGVADRLLDAAGPEIRRVAWMTRYRTAIADMPPCPTGPYRYGRAIGRDLLDAVLLERARELGVRVIQPAQARRLYGRPGEFVCEYRSRPALGQRPRAADERISVAIVVDAHGSWEREPVGGKRDPNDGSPARPHHSDLLGFKATFSDTRLVSGLLPVLSLPGGYGGMVVSDRGRTTVACCIRRDVLRDWRSRTATDSAGAAVEVFLRSTCHGVAAALDGARLDEEWKSIGPLRPGFHAPKIRGVLSVGNAAAEAHPLIGEGICMALESATLLASLLGERPSHLEESVIGDVQEAHIRASRVAFARRMRMAHFYSRLAMRQRVATALAALMQLWPPALTLAAQFAGKARGGEMRERFLRLPRGAEARPFPPG